MICGIAWLLILCSGCSTVPPLDISHIPHTVTYYDDRAEFMKARGKPSPLGGTIHGFYKRRNGVCHIHIMREWPKKDACTLRHEQRHCLEGNWHKGPNNDCDTDGRGMSINGVWSY